MVSGSADRPRRCRRSGSGKIVRRDIAGLQASIAHTTPSAKPGHQIRARATEPGEVHRLQRPCPFGGAPHASAIQCASSSPSSFRQYSRRGARRFRAAAKLCSTYCRPRATAGWFTSAASTITASTHPGPSRPRSGTKSHVPTMELPRRRTRFAVCLRRQRIDDRIRESVARAAGERSVARSRVQEQSLGRAPARHVGRRMRSRVRIFACRPASSDYNRKRSVYRG